jgi:hypothetical protein
MSGTRTWGALSKFGAETVVTEPNGATFTLTVILGVADGADESAHCPANVKCTSGTAPLQGHEVSWAYTDQLGNAPTAKPSGSGATTEVRAGYDAASLDVVDPVSHYGLVVGVTGKAVPNLPTMADLKNIGLNDKVVAALLAARS